MTRRDLFERETFGAIIIEPMDYGPPLPRRSVPPDADDYLFLSMYLRRALWCDAFGGETRKACERTRQELEAEAMTHLERLVVVGMVDPDTWTVAVWMDGDRIGLDVLPTSDIGIRLRDQCRTKWRLDDNDRIAPT